MSDWTLGAVKARNIEIVALCDAASCRHMFVGLHTSPLRGGPASISRGWGGG